jgi:hypothetical protein
MYSKESCEIMTLDKTLYQQAYRSYRQWNEAEAIARARDAAMLTSAEAWQQYVAVVELCWRLSPQPSQYQRDEKLATLDRYYVAVQRLEERRRAHGTSA